MAKVKFKVGDWVKVNPRYESIAGTTKPTGKITKIYKKRLAQTGFMLTIENKGDWDQNWVVKDNQSKNMKTIKKFLGVKDEV